MDHPCNVPVENIMTRILVVILLATGVLGCAGGGGGSGNRNFSRTLQIGPGTAPASSALDAVANHDQVSVSYGQAPDASALSVSYLVSYLRADADDDYDNTGGTGHGIIRRFAAPPVVRVADVAAPELVRQVANVVRAINAALPNDWQLTFSRTPASVPADSHVWAPEGEIHVHFSSRTQWPAEQQDAAGYARTYYRCLDISCRTVAILSGRTYVDPSVTSGRVRERVIAHEILHNLGRLHADPMRFPDTIMDPRSTSADSEKPILDPLDREALLAVYGSLTPGTPSDQIEDDLGPWATEGSHIRGILAIADSTIAFGTSMRNGRIQPWVSGPRPDTSLAENEQLGVSVTYNGRLLGFTSNASTIAGRADLAVRLATLDGDLSFTELETWPAGTAPGASGTGSAYQSGTGLNYRIAIADNTFIKAGGDAGEINGAFFGAGHEGMGGTVRRDDFTGAFAGKR